MARQMTEEHKAALAKGRRESRAVRDYLDALDRESRSSGRRMSREAIKERIGKVEEQIESEENAAKRVELIQKRIDLENDLQEVEDAPDMSELEAAFVESVGGYSERKGITYSAWREAGVPAAVLKKGGIKRTRRAS